MQDYRAYLLGPDGRIKNRIDLVCENDEAAKQLWTAMTSS